ncbi:MAG: IS21-like element helper ATPase IstB [Spirochaetaceae bacterium]|nr:IS21-like element helper ATPase IstB [Spirochaetaceae bacterium]
MNNNQITISKMKDLRLHGMAGAFVMAMESGSTDQYTIDEFLTHLIDAEWNDRNERKRVRLTWAAGFRYQASMMELDYTEKRNLDKNLMLRLSEGRWITEGKDILITAATGLGKSFLGSALGHHACDHGYRVMYRSTGQLMGALKEGKRDGSYLKLLEKIYKSDVLILDDFGLSTFDDKARLALLDILEDRHGRKSTLILSQLPVASWHGLIGDSTIADAIMDRIVYGAYRIELKWESYRKKMYRNS